MQKSRKTDRSFKKPWRKLDNVQVLSANEIAPLAVAKLVGNAELLVPMAGFINKEAELAFS